MMEFLIVFGGAAAAYFLLRGRTAPEPSVKTIPISTSARKPVGGPTRPAPVYQNTIDPIVRVNTSGRGWTRAGLETLVDDAEKMAGFPPGLLAALASHESNWNPLAVNRATHDYGLFQINLQHFGKPGFPRNEQDALDPEVSTAAAVLLVREAIQRWGTGDWSRIIAEYNGGPRAAATKPYRNQGYVDAVLNKWAEVLA